MRLLLRESSHPEVEMFFKAVKRSFVLVLCCSLLFIVESKNTRAHAEEKSVKLAASVEEKSSTTTAPASEKPINSAGKLTALILIDTDTGETIQEVRDGDILDLSQLENPRFTLRADTSSETTAITFQVGKGSMGKKITKKPFFIAGEKNGLPLPWKVSAGQQSVTITPYMGIRAGEKHTFHFGIIDPFLALKDNSTSPAKPSASLNAPLPAKDTKARAAFKATTPNKSGLSKIGPANQCKAIINKASLTLTIVCSHDFFNVSEGRLSSPDFAENDSTLTACRFPNASSPMIASCQVTTELINALHDNKLSVELLFENKSLLAIPVEL